MEASNKTCGNCQHFMAKGALEIWEPSDTGFCGGLFKATLPMMQSKEWLHAAGTNDASECPLWELRKPKVRHLDLFDGRKHDLEALRNLCEQY